MTETLTLTPRRLVVRTSTLLVAVALAAAVALGFGIRTWTEHTTHPATVRTVAPIVQPAPGAVGDSPTGSDPVRRFGKPN